jgi:hypothetical protein
MVKRMDLIPETEQIHLLMIVLFGLPRSILITVNDLIKIDKKVYNRYTGLIYSIVSMRW